MTSPNRDKYRASGGKMLDENDSVFDLTAWIKSVGVSILTAFKIKDSSGAEIDPATKQKQDEIKTALDSVGIADTGDTRIDPAISDNQGSLDSITGAKNVIAYPHHEIHEGDHYYMEGFVELDIDQTLYVKLVTPNNSKWSHFKWEIESNGIIETYLYEAVSGGMTGGSGVTPLNNNRNSANTSGMIITSGVTVASDLGTTVGQKKVGGTGFKSVSGGEVNREDELILKQNTTYLRKFLSKSDNNIISFRASWYEHTNI